MYNISFYTFGSYTDHDEEVFREEHSKNLFEKYEKRIGSMDTIYLKKISEVTNIKDNEIEFKTSFDKMFIYKLQDINNLKYSFKCSWLFTEFATKMIRIFANRTTEVILIVERIKEEM
jgi:hypothetical protein